MSKKVIVSLFIFLLIISCSNNDANGPDTNSIIGTWNLTTMKVDGSTINPDEEDSIPYKIRFHSDNSTGVVWMKDYGLLDPDSPMSFTWFTNGNILTFSTTSSSTIIVRIFPFVNQVKDIGLSGSNTP